MVKLRIEEILTEKGKSKYWLNQRLNMCYRNFNNLVSNNTTSVRFETLDKLSEILEVPVQDLFIQIPDKSDKK
jgi:DNA-binding Xre family transcriptional regulator